jgi:hypothetical protein
MIVYTQSSDFVPGGKGRSFLQELSEKAFPCAAMAAKFSLPGEKIAVYSAKLLLLLQYK